MSEIGDYLSKIPEDKSSEEWSIAAAAFIGTLAHSPEIDVSDEVRFSTLVLYARMPSDLEELAKAHIDEKIGKYIETTEEFAEGKAEVEELIEAIENGLDPDD